MSWDRNKRLPARETDIWRKASAQGDVRARVVRAYSCKGTLFGREQAALIKESKVTRHAQFCFRARYSDSDFLLYLFLECAHFVVAHLLALALMRKGLTLMKAWGLCVHFLLKLATIHRVHVPYEAVIPYASIREPLANFTNSTT